MPNSQVLKSTLGFLPCAVSALLKHARIVGQRLQIPENDPTELRVGRVDQAVFLVWGENRRYEKYAALAARYKLIAEPG